MSDERSVRDMSGHDMRERNEPYTQIYDASNPAPQTFSFRGRRFDSLTLDFMPTVAGASAGQVAVYIGSDINPAAPWTIVKAGTLREGPLPLCDWITLIPSADAQGILRVIASPHDRGAAVYASS